MKTEEVLERYKEGERNFRRVNLGGQSFKGKNLSRADFSEADIRGANFTNANLIGANFRGAKAGIQDRWAIGLVLASWLISGISAIFSMFPGYFVSLALDISNLQNFSAGITSLIVLTVFFIATIRHGLAAGLIAVAVAGVLAGAVAFAFDFSLAVVAALAGAVPVAFAGAVAVAVAVARAVAGAFAGAVAGAFAMLGVYVGWRGLAGDEKHAWVRSFAITFAATGGTSFRGADLTNADFTSATLKSTDFRGAILIRTCWHQAKKLDRVRPGTTYLRNVQLQQWLIGKGQNKNFDRQDLRGVNLKAANLMDASFISADLSEANLQDADLSRAKLVQTQLDRTDFTGATLTGAYIEDWGITGDTEFKGVRCEYVYMRLPTKENPDPLRKPDNRQEVFADGEFGDFIKPIVDTLDLYHNQGVDPRAIAISFKQLAEDHPEAELRIVGMEVRGEDNFLLRAKVAPGVDKSELSAEYVDNYNQFKGLPEREIRVLLAEKDIRIRSLENMVVTALQRPYFYSETNIDKVATVSQNPGGISQNVSGGQVYGGMQAAQGEHNQQTMETKVTAPAEKQLDKSEVIALLEEIEKLIRGAELPVETKEEATSYLGAAKKATEKEQPNKEIAKVNLKGMAETLENASKSVASSKSLWENVKPILMQLPGWLGVAKSFFGF